MKSTDFGKYINYGLFYSVRKTEYNEGLTESDLSSSDNDEARYSSYDDSSEVTFYFEI